MSSAKYFCVHCGRELNPKTLHCDSCKVGFEDRFVKCANCGTLIVDGGGPYTYHPKKPPNLIGEDANDGMRLQDSEIPSEIWDVLKAPGYSKQTKNKESRKYWLAATVALLLCLVGAAVFVLLS